LATANLFLDLRGTQISSINQGNPPLHSYRKGRPHTHYGCGSQQSIGFR